MLEHQYFQISGWPPDSVQGSQPAPPAQPQLLQAFLPSRPIFCDISRPSSSSAFLATRWSLENFTCPCKSVSNKPAVPCRAPKPPVRVEQEEAPAALLPAAVGEVQPKEWQPGVGREMDARSKAGERKGKGKEGRVRARQQETERHF